MKIEKMPPIGHVGIVVENMEETLSELRSIYGLNGLDTVYDFKPMRVWAWGKEIDGCHIRICMVDWTETLKMEILQPVSGLIEHERFVREAGGGLHHSAYYVDDYDGYRAFIVEKGGDIIFETETEDARGYRRCCYARFKASNTVVEVLENARIRQS